MQCAVLTVERDELRADLDAERDAAELKSACITGMRQEITAWSITAANLEAERDALKARIETDMKSWYKLHYLMKKHGWHPGRTDDDLINVLEAKLSALAKQKPVAWIGDSPSNGNGRRLFWSYAEAYKYASKTEPLFSAAPEVGDSSFESWYQGWLKGTDGIGPKQAAREAYAAGMLQQAISLKLSTPRTQ